MPGGQVTEIIAQFAGYLHIQNYMAKAHVDYEDFLIGRLQREEDSDPYIDAPLRFELDDMISLPTGSFSFAALPGTEAGPTWTAFQFHDLSVRVGSMHMDHPDYTIRFPAPVPLPGSAKLEISIEYGIGGSELIVEVDQDNRLIDDDILLPEGTTPVHHTNSMAALQHLVDLSEAELPANLALDGHGADALSAQFGAYHAAWQDDDDWDGNLIEQGLYINGELQLDDTEVPSPDDVERELPESDEAAQIALAGGNQASNVALIVDINHTLGTLIVAGDYFRTDAIIQINAYTDNDKLVGSSYDWADEDGNEAYNAANFITSDPGIGSFAGGAAFAGLTWRVDIHDGDFYDIRALVQQNWIRDNDISLQTNHESHFQLVLGENEQANLAQFISLAQAYDLVIVLGDYHEVNLIYQKNILVDADYLAATGGQGALNAGGNFLLNDATIEQFGGTAIHENDSRWDDLIEQLESGATTLDTSYGKGLPNFNDGSFDVLIVKGDMYDMNVIEQVNLVEDADTVTLHAEKDVAQLADVGANQLVNAAAIVSTGPAADAYVAGDLYEEEVLIQAEIIEDDDDLVYGDTTALANELVAFTSHDDDDDHSYSNSGHGSHGDGDMLGSILS